MYWASTEILENLAKMNKTTVLDPKALKLTRKEEEFGMNCKNKRMKSVL